MDSVRIRPARPDDAENIAALVNTAFRAERFFTSDDRTNPEKVRTLLNKGKFLLAEESGALVGCVYVELRGDRGYFGMLAVDLGRQKSGIGTLLISAAENECRASGSLFMDLTIVHLRTELPDYYRKRGYVHNGVEPFITEAKLTQPCYLIKMTKPLTSQDRQRKHG